MEKEIYLTNLYDYYKVLLTEKQREYFEDYYFDNLTINEIAENNEVSKAVISKTLIEVKEKLDDYEAKLHLYNNYQEISKLVDQNTLSQIEEFI